MTEFPQDPLDRLLDAWETPEARDLAPEVWRRIEAARQRRGRWFGHPAFIGGLAAACAALAVVCVLDRRAIRAEKARERVLTENYLRMIDPAEAPLADRIADQDLTWMKEGLGLSDAQFAAVRSAHEAEVPRLRWCAAQLEQLRQSYAKIQQRWHEDNEVDFLAVADLQAAERNLDSIWSHALRQLIDTSDAAMTPQQRARYLQIVGPVLAHAGHAAVVPNS